MEGFCSVEVDDLKRETGRLRTVFFSVETALEMGLSVVTTAEDCRAIVLQDVDTVYK